MVGREGEGGGVREGREGGGLEEYSCHSVVHYSFREFGKTYFLLLLLPLQSDLGVCSQ